MRERRRRVFERAADIAIVVALLALSAFAYGRVSIGIGTLMESASGVEFTDLYQPGQNPWAGALVEPMPTGGRFASLSRARQPFR